ncbi:hypothetical protein [Streptococcus parauberis]|uniref:hypothetical protein n=1 Tax=Streptococcus parauberis TaxID=1348 RepID=UPI0021A423FB|nr:hypothetical protein [Streptococcus parauberis]UWM91899.1 hypothetical protein N2A94_04500 [Streptococcus parauberis]
MGLEKVIELNSKKPSIKTVPVQNSGTIESRNKTEDTSMPQENYSKNEIDLKFENLEQKNDSKFDNLTQKIDDGFEKQILKMENLLFNFKEDLNKEQKENKKWLIGISIGSGLTIIGIIVSIIALFHQ